MKLSYTAYDRSGKLVGGVQEASDADALREQLRRDGLFPMEVGDGAQAPSGGGRHRLFMERRTSGKHLAVFARELSVLVATGTPVVEALGALERQTRDERWRRIVSDVRQRVEEGDPLSAAMGAHARVFDAVSRSLVSAGESSGRLEEMLERLAILTRRQASTRSMLIGALVYPVLLIVVAIVVLALMLLVVMPRFAGLFESMDVELPGSTRALLAFGDIVRTYWWALLPGLMAAGAGLAAWLRSRAGRRLIDTAAVRLPQIGRLTRSFATARVTRLMGVLLHARVSMTETLELVRESMSNHHYVALIDRAESAVTRGEPVSAAFSDHALIVPSVCEAVRNGETSGRLAEVLLSVADYLDEENETVMRTLSSLLEPVIMITLGVVVGFVAVSMFLPLFDLTASAGGA